VVATLCAGLMRRGERALAQLLRAAAVSAFRPLLIAVAAVTVRLTPVRRLPRLARRISTTRTRLFTHSLGRRGPPCSPAFA